MTSTPSEIEIKRSLHLQKRVKIGKKALHILVLVAIIFSYTIFPFVYAIVESPSGKDILFVEPASKESITKFLNLGEKISGKITASGGDNYISFKLFDPAGNLCLWMNVFQSVEFSWGPVEESGEYKLEFDNWFDSSNGNTVNLEFQITNPQDYSSPIPFALIIAAVLSAIIIPVAIVLHHRSKKVRSSHAKVVANYVYRGMTRTHRMHIGQLVYSCPRSSSHL